MVYAYIQYETLTCFRRLESIMIEDKSSNKQPSTQINNSNFQSNNDGNTTAKYLLAYF